MAVGARLRSGWMRIVQHLGEAQTVVLLSLVYACVLAAGAALRLAGRADLLELHRARGESFALPKQRVPTDRERCERQF
jgi:hypothetical protein